MNEYWIIRWCVKRWPSPDDIVIDDEDGQAIKALIIFEVLNKNTYSSSQQARSVAEHFGNILASYIECWAIYHVVELTDYATSGNIHNECSFKFPEDYALN